jgi:hypothetical protein
MLGLTEDLGWPELECRAVVDGGWAAEVVEARGEDRRRGTPGCWAPWIASRGACGGVQGVRTARTPPAGRELPWRSSSPGAAPSRNLGETEARGSIAGLGELTGAEAKLMQGSAGSGVQRSDGSTVTQRSRRGGANERRRQGFGGSCSGEGRGRRG